MKVTKAQAQANREHIVETASVLFRKYGYEGVGIADLMAASGFTHGGFYRHFRSKADLMAEAAKCSFNNTQSSIAHIDISDFFKDYLSRTHRDFRSTGCTLAALCGDAARQHEDIKSEFLNGIEEQLSRLKRMIITHAGSTSSITRAKLMSLLAQAVGAIMISRACPDDSATANEVLEVCLSQIISQIPE
ncbi:TetR/AcrR family transcriptional regulator [Pseudomonas tolaasii]|uniref:TetR/AcrR family transcriptional regulator n=1 Tax=Pseudomonas tolaasii TaxID=29442 RepID=UPI001C5678D8|nr:TetR/AcrR family transcriptional regulator [Pseudomonas tolaasii]